MTVAQSQTLTDGARPRGYVDKAMASTYCCVSVRSLDYAKSRGELPYYRLGRKVVFALDDLDEWLAQHRIDVRDGVV